jgi:repressor LexA
MFKPEKEQTAIFAENLRWMLSKRDMSQRDLSRKINVSVQAINRWAKGTGMPSAESMDAICRALNCQRQDLLQDRQTIPNLSVPAAHAVPVLGSICAGNGILAEQNFDGYFFVDNSIRADYCLHVEGDSMKEAGINHGDIAFIRKSYDLLDGEIYAVVFGENESAVLKKVYRQGEGLLLMPCNQRYAPLYVDDARIVGECIGVYHPR